MTTTKDRINEIIDQLADKTLSFGCRVEFDMPEATLIRTGAVLQYDEDDRCVILPDSDGSPWCMSINAKPTKVLGHPVHLHDVLDKICSDCDTDCENPNHLNRKMLVVAAWQQLGIKKSLQEIAETKSNEANALFSYLDTLFPKL